MPDLSSDPPSTISSSVSKVVTFADTPTAMFSLFLPSPLVNPSVNENPRIFMFPARILEGKAPRIMASIDGVTFPLLLDTGGEVSILPMDLFRHFNQTFDIASGSRVVSTCLLYTSPSPRDGLLSRMPSSA